MRQRINKCFLRRGLTVAVLKLAGKEPSDRDRFTRVVIGVTRTSIHEFNKEVEIESRQQVVLEVPLVVFLCNECIRSVWLAIYPNHLSGTGQLKNKEQNTRQKVNFLRIMSGGDIV